MLLPNRRRKAQESGKLRSPRSGGGRPLNRDNKRRSESAGTEGLFLFGRCFVLHPGHLLRQTGREFFVLDIINAKRAEHVI